MMKKYKNEDEYFNANVFCDTCGKRITDPDNEEDYFYRIASETMCKDCADKMTVEQWIDWLGGEKIER